MFDFIIYALLGGVGLCLVFSILGNFIVWKRMSYIGDSVAHSSILGIAIGLACSIAPDIIIILVSFVVSVFLVSINKKFNLAQDALLIFITQFSLSVGFIIISLIGNKNNITSYLFGNILALELKDILIIYGISICVIIYTFLNWEKILFTTINEDMASAENINTFAQNILFVFIVACIVAFGVKFIGILLIPSLSIIPALIASNVAKTPFSAVIISFFIGVLSIILGITVSIYLDIPVGALITAILVFIMLIQIIALLLNNLLKKS